MDSELLIANIPFVKSEKWVAKSIIVKQDEEFKENPKDYTDQDLMFFFNLMHDLYAKKVEGERIRLAGKTWENEDIINYYVLIVNEMDKRNLQRVRTSLLDQDAQGLFGKESKKQMDGCLNKNIRDIIPEEFHYWKKEGAEALEIHDKLIKAVKNKEIQIDLQKLLTNSKDD